MTGTQALLLVASETGHVYTFATPKLQPFVTLAEGKALIQGCLNTPDPNGNTTNSNVNANQSAQTNSQMETLQMHANPHFSAPTQTPHAPVDGQTSMQIIEKRFLLTRQSSLEYITRWNFKSLTSTVAAYESTTTTSPTISIDVTTSKCCGI